MTHVVEWYMMSKEERANVVRFYLIDNAWTYGQLAAHLGVTRNTIAGICHREGIRADKSKPKSAETLPAPPLVRPRNVIPFPQPEPVREEAVSEMVRKAKEALKAKRRNGEQSNVLTVLANRREDVEVGKDPVVKRHTGPAWEPLPDLVPIRLMDLKSCDCRWPVTEETGWFCGAPAAEGKTYCAAHAQRAYIPTKPIQFKARPKERRYG
jgi:GcrA cell cycle regulator